MITHATHNFSWTHTSAHFRPSLTPAHYKQDTIQRQGSKPNKRVLFASVHTQLQTYGEPFDSECEVLLLDVTCGFPSDDERERARSRGDPSTPPPAGVDTEGARRSLRERESERSRSAEALFWRVVRLLLAAGSTTMPLLPRFFLSIAEMLPLLLL